MVRIFFVNKKNGHILNQFIIHLLLFGQLVKKYFLVCFFETFLFSLGFGDFVPLANVQRTGESLYSRWAYFIFTVSFILFGLAIMASSLNLLVLRLAQFHSENGAGGLSSFLGRNEEDLIAEAIAHHRASIHMQQHNRICLNNNVNQQQKPTQSYSLMRTYSWYSASSSSSSSSSSKERTCCSSFLFFNNHKRKRRHWHLRRSPQNIKHLIYFDHLLENHSLTLLRKPPMSLPHHHHHLTNHTSQVNLSKQQRVSI